MHSRADALFEIIRKLDLVEENPRIMVVAIESILELPDTLHRTVYVLVPTEHEEDCVRLAELRIEGSDVDHFLLLSTVAVEQMRDGSLLAIGFV